MNALTALASYTAPASTAEVIGPEDGALAVLRDGARVVARRAFSCLVDPAPGDLVLLGDADGRAYVLAVLERRCDAPMHLALPDGARLDAAGGRLDIVADRLTLQAREGTLAAETLNVSSRRVEARFVTASVVAQAIESVAERILGRFRRSYRFVEEGEQLRAREIDHRASGHMNLKGDTVALHAGLIVKIDGGQIHMG